MLLFDYMQDVQRLLRDGSQELVNPQDLITYINRARTQVAMQSQSIRRLPPISGGITTITVDDGGSGYTAPTATITAPDAPSGYGSDPAGLQATAQVNISGGVITSIDVTEGGSGYFNPQVTITDATGSGAEATAATSSITKTAYAQEVYNFSSIPLDTFPGVESVLAIRSVTILYSNYRYGLLRYPFSTYQYMIRQYPTQYIYVPAFCTQFGQGVDGSLYMYPLPSQAYQYELDCTCLPSPLTSNTSVEALPEPWRQAVAKYAAYLAFQELQNLNYANWYLKQFTEFMHQYGAAARPGTTPNPYGRW